MSPATSASSAESQRILEAAERLFLDFGYGGFTMDKLAEALGMSKKTLYKHYEGKDELLAFVLDGRSTRLDRELTALLEGHSDGRADFGAKMVTFIEYVVERFAEISEPFLQDVRRNAPDLFRKIEDYREQHIPRHMRRLLDQGISAGLFRRDVPPEIVVGMLLHAAQNMLLPRPGRPKLTRTPGELMDMIVRVVLEGIVRRDGALRKKSAPPAKQVKARRAKHPH